MLWTQKLILVSIRRLRCNIAQIYKDRHAHFLKLTPDNYNRDNWNIFFLKNHVFFLKKVFLNVNRLLLLLRFFYFVLSCFFAFASLWSFFFLKSSWKKKQYLSFKWRNILYRMRNWFENVWKYVYSVCKNYPESVLTN